MVAQVSRLYTTKETARAEAASQFAQYKLSFLDIVATERQYWDEIVLGRNPLMMSFLEGLQFSQGHVVLHLDDTFIKEVPRLIQSAQSALLSGNFDSYGVRVVHFPRPTSRIVRNKNGEEARTITVGPYVQISFEVGYASIPQLLQILFDTIGRYAN